MKKLKITKPGLYQMTPAEYAADPCPQPSLRRSVAQTLIDLTPRHAWEQMPRLNPDYREERTKETNLGNVCHDLLLHGGDRIRVVKARDWKGGAAQIARTQAHRNGQFPILERDFQDVQYMLKALREQIASDDDWPTAFTNGRAGMVLVWKEQIAPREFVWCRAELDWLMDDYLTNPNTPWPDYKSCGGFAHPDYYASAFFRDGLAFQEAFYRRGIRKTLGITWDPRFVFCVQEVRRPHAMMFHAPDPAVQAKADVQVDRAIRTFGACMQTGKWPGYPKGTNYIQLPGYMEKRWDEAENFHRGSTSKEMLALMREWQSPFEGKKS